MSPEASSSALGGGPGLGARGGGGDHLSELVDLPTVGDRRDPRTAPPFLAIAAAIGPSR